MDHPPSCRQYRQTAAEMESKEGRKETGTRMGVTGVASEKEAEKVLDEVKERETSKNDTADGATTRTSGRDSLSSCRPTHTHNNNPPTTATANLTNSSPARPIAYHIHTELSSTTSSSQSATTDLS